MGVSFLWALLVRRVEMNSVDRERTRYVMIKNASWMMVREANLENAHWEK